MLDFSNKLIAAPMVRISNLPFRLLCLKYGCNIVYSDEIIDYKLVKCKRFVNDKLGTVDYINEEDHVVFRTCAAEKDKVVLQLGTADADRALIAAKLVEKDVAGIDINMGCPKSFSIKGGMGAALLTQPHKIKQILTNLVENLSVPVTCKIRVLPELKDTIELVKVIESTNVSAIAIHGRTKTERPNDPNRNNYIKSICENLKIPVIANGDSGNIETYDDILKFKKKSMASSVMIARSAKLNCSIFRKDGLLNKDDVISEYLDLCIRYENHFSLAKYTIQCMLENSPNSQLIEERNKEFLATSTIREICALWKKADDYDRIREEFKTKLLNNDQELENLELENLVNNDRLNQQNKNGTAIESNNNQLNGVQQLNKASNIAENLDDNPVNRKRKLIELIKDEENADEILCLRFIRNFFDDNDKLPKSIMYRVAMTNKKKITYRTVQKDKRFYCICEYDGKKYSNTYLEKSKKYAEQAAALVACFKLNLISKEIIEKCRQTC